MLKWWGLFVLLGVQSFAWGVSLNPAIQWKVLKTPHFRVIYDSKDKELASQYAYYAEKSRARLSLFFTDVPERVTILLDDSSDSANGFATFLPYRYISIFPVLPDDATSLENFQVWSELILLHEYTHILQFEPVHGMYTPFRYIFGRLLTPNALLPNWLMEGMAVDFETQLSEAGRLRSSSTNARIRAEVEDKTLDEETIDQLNESGIPSFPFGERPYFFGGLLMHATNQKISEKTSDYLVQRYGRRIPFLMDGPIEDKLGKNWVTVWDDLRADLTTRANQQTAEIRAGGNGFEETKVFPESKSMQTFVRLSPNRNRLIFIDVTNKLSRRLYLVERTENGFDFSKKQFLVKLQSTGRVEWAPDSETLVFDQMAYVHRDQYFKDIYSFHIPTKELKRLTRGQRAGDASVSPDGKKVVFVATIAGATELKELDLESGLVTFLAKSRLQERISWPLYDLDGSILFALRNIKGIQSIYRKSVGSEPQKFYSGLKNMNALRMTSEGLVTVSDHNGVRNLYLLQNGSVKALTHTTTEVIGGDYDAPEKMIYYARLTGHGPKLYRSSSLVLKESLPVVQPLVNVPSQDSQPEFAAVDVKEESYSPWPYMWPTYWFPFIYPASEGYLIQGSTSIYDPLGKHNYSLQGSVDTFTEKGSFAGSYTHRNRYRALSVLTAHTSSPVSLVSKQTIDSDYVAGDSSFYLTDGFKWPMSAGYSYSDESYAGSAPYRRQGPSITLGYSTQVPKDPDGKDYELGNGYSVALRLDSFIDIEDFLAYDRASFSFQTATSSWLPDDHELSFAFRGSFAPEMPVGFIRFIGDTTAGASYVANLISSSYLMRGYPSGTFRGRKLLNANLEYEFTFAETYAGHDLWPVFLKETKLAFFLDAVSVDGYYSNALGAFFRSDQFKDTFLGTGFEFRFDLTMGFKAPVIGILGMHFPVSDKTDHEPSVFFGFGLGDLTGLNNNRLTPSKFGH